MNSLNAEALKKLSEVHEFEAKQYLKVVNHLKDLGLGHHASHAVLDLEKSRAMLAKL